MIKLQDIKMEKDHDKIEVKEYVDFITKKSIIYGLIENAKETFGGLVKIDYALLSAIKDVTIISQYTNIEIGEDVIADYDYLKQNKILDYVLDRIDKSEIEFIEEILKQEIEQVYKIENSLENILYNISQELIAKIPDEKGIKNIIKEIPKNINKIKPEMLEVMKNMK